jgi:FlaA1/EpsC-like NDP-sugar epimerase
MGRLSGAWRDLRIVVRAIWLNVAVYITMLLSAVILEMAFNSYPNADFTTLFVRAFHMSILEPVELGTGIIPILLTFTLPLFAVGIVGEGALRVISVYLRRGRRSEDWDLLVAQTYTNHTVICGVGELGRAVVQRLVASNPSAQVVLVDTRPNILAELGLTGSNICLVQADMTAQEALEQANCQKASLIILTSGSDAFNLEAGFKALKLNPKAEIWIRLYRVGLTELLELEKKQNVHFFAPYEHAAEDFVGIIARTSKENQGR